jgi:hypothetical protein
MKLVRAMAIVFFLAMGAGLIVLSANAQSPSATPTTSAPVGQIPETVPPNWKANGWDQSSWTGFREHCRAIFAHPGKFSHHEWVTCANVSVAFSFLPEPSLTPLAVASGSPTPLPTPLPPAPPVGSQSSDAATSGPPTVGANFPGGGLSACPGPSPAPGVQAPTQPLDVAADVSGTQNVEMLNQGMFVYDKSGNQQGSESLYSFWCQHPGANSKTLPACNLGTNAFPLDLSDTQVAFDYFKQKWVASTMASTSDTPLPTVHDVLFAVSTSASAVDGTGAWERYDIPVCIGVNQVFPDQPILGYSSGWVAIDTTCLAANLSHATDSLVLIPQTAVAAPPQTLTPTIISPPAFASRPARDMSNASGAGNPSYPQLILASSGFNATSPPMVSLFGIPNPSPSAIPSPTFLGNSPTSWGFPGGGNRTIPAAPQVGCTVPSSNCMIDASDQFKIEQATIQYNPKTLNHYLLTSFTAGYQNGAEAIWYIDDLETPGGNWAGQWTGTGNTGWVPTYTTITSDDDFDINATATSFTSSAAPFSTWFGWHDFPQMLGIPETNFATSTGVYTGQSTCPAPITGLQRWGDYNSLIWDPSLFSSSGEPGLFWSVAELSKGGTDQSTVWTQLDDTLPYFVGPPSQTSQNESECSGGTGSTCKVTVTAPSGIQVGDVVLVALLLGEPAAHPPGLPDTSWTLLSASNITNNPTMIASGGCSGTCVTAWLAAHIYTSSDSGTYTFSHFLNSNTELGALLAAYRGGGQNLANYKAYGFTQNGISSSFSTKAVTPPAESTLAAFVAPDGGCDSPESAEATSEKTTIQTGAPALTPETSLTNFISSWIVADAGVPNTGQAYGPYTLTESQVGGCQGIGAIWLAWEVAIPEQ